MYYLLTESFKDQHQLITDIILKACAVEKIYFLGSALYTRRTETIFMTDAPACRYASHYYLLVTISNECNHNQVQDTIENACAKLVPVTAIVLSEERFKAWLQEGHAFAHSVYLKAFLLHGEKDILSLPVSVKDEAFIQKGNNPLYTAGLNKSEAFLAGADLYRIREQNKLCAFMLHQAAEQCLNTLLEINTGLRVVTHSIDKLLRYCTMVCPYIPEIFFTGYEKDKRLLSVLQKSYIDSRYNNSYCVNDAELKQLTEKVKRIYEMVKSERC